MEPTINNLSRLDKNRCAFLIIDMQNDFVSEGAPIECTGGRALIPAIAAMRAWCKQNGIPVMYTKEQHRRQKVDFGMELERHEPEHCVEGTDGIEIVAGLAPDEEDYVIVKRRYSAFYLTDLEVLMKGLKRDCLILAGVATNVCVYATALDAQERDFHVVVLEDCVVGTSPDLHVAFLKNIDYVMGDVTSSTALQKLLDGK